MKHLTELLRISSVNIQKLDREAVSQKLQLIQCPFTKEQLTELYLETNGWIAFENSLRVIPLFETESHVGFSDWNCVDHWKKFYQYDSLIDFWFFGEDVFGNQFGFYEKKIYLVNLETLERELIGDSIEDWAKQILDDYNYLTGYGLSHQWQVINRPLEETEILIPKIPFLAGGEYSVENLYAIDRMRGIAFYSEIFNQTKDLPDGAKIEFRFDL